jgi:redox-sensitive bicupin YhaK (pirin superfamily)
MIVVRKAEERGHANHGWLNTYHTFSFANYYDPNYLGFRSLRVINEDRVTAGAGFGTHGHKDMEIITYVLEGALEHKDSIGTGSIIQPGEIQRMSAGTGILHSEFNPSSTEEVHFLQIWILPDRKDLKPSYEQQKFELEKTPGELKLIVSPNGRDNSVTVHQDMNLYAGILDTGDRISYSLTPQRHAWIQVAKGAILVNGNLLDPSDGAAISEETELTIEAKEKTEILLFDLA